MFARRELIRLRLIVEPPKPPVTGGVRRFYYTTLRSIVTPKSDEGCTLESL